MASTRDRRLAAMKRTNQGSALGRWRQRTTRGCMESRNILGAFLRVSGMPSGGTEARPNEPALPKVAASPGPSRSIKVTAKPSRCR